MQKKCREYRFNVRGSEMCRVKDRATVFERSRGWWRFDCCGKGGRWWKPKVERKRRVKPDTIGGAI